MKALIRSVLLPNLDLSGIFLCHYYYRDKGRLLWGGRVEEFLFEWTFPWLDQGVMVFCKIRTVGNKGQCYVPSIKGFLQELRIIFKLYGTFRFQGHWHSSKSGLIWPCNSICFKLDMANKCLNSKFDITTNGIFKQQPSSWRDICFSMFIIHNVEKN